MTTCPSIRGSILFQPQNSLLVFGARSDRLGSMIDPDENDPYTVEPDAGRFRVVDWEGNVILACGDSPSAEQYAELMNRAFRRGFKAGFRKARTS